MDVVEIVGIEPTSRAAFGLAGFHVLPVRLPLLASPQALSNPVYPRVVRGFQEQPQNPSPLSTRGQDKDCSRRNSPLRHP